MPCAWLGLGTNDLQHTCPLAVGRQIKITSRKDKQMMSWIISPWEAARLALEAQRSMAFHFLRLASGQEGQIKELFAEDQAKTPPLVDESVGAFLGPAIRAKSTATDISKTVAVRKKTGSIRKRVTPSHSKIRGKGNGRS
jgi:hypothetical protein